MQQKNYKALKRNLTHSKNDFFNLLEYITNLLAAFRKNGVELASTKVSPKKRICVTCKLVWPKILLLIRMVCFFLFEKEILVLNMI